MTTVHASRPDSSSQRAPLISVVVPAHNAERTVCETIESIRRQTFRDFEIIVIDDGSTDGTLACVRAVDDPRLRLFSYANGGLAAARNRGVERSRGEFVSFIDADDLWTPDKLELQLTALRQNPEAAFAYSWTAFIDEESRFLFAKEPFHHEGDVFPELLRECFLASGSNMFVRRHCALEVGGFDTTLAAAQDWDFCLRVAARWPFAVVKRYQILYRISPGAMSGNARQCEQSCLVIADRGFSRTSRAQLVKRRECISTVKQYAAFLYMTRAPDHDKARKAGQKLLECVRLFPPTLLTRKTWCLLATWSVLLVSPRRLHRRVVIALLRTYGRWLSLRYRDVRKLAKMLARSDWSSREESIAIARIDRVASDVCD